tara:strand:- start:254 stop:493 length:240 start_codon:yes stop_codon:yes gene_type:complete
MKIPKNLTPAWLAERKYRLVEIFQNGYRLAILHKVGSKWAHLRTLENQRIKIRKSELINLKPVVRRRGGWKVVRDGAIA